MMKKIYPLFGFLVAGCWLLTAGIFCDTEEAIIPKQPLELLQPKGGESYKVNQTVVIQWQVNDTLHISTVGIRLSLDGGKSFPQFLGGISFPLTTNSYSWVVESSQISSQCVIKVFDYIDVSVSTVSGVFSVGN
jgi:hypothetical protein